MMRPASNSPETTAGMILSKDGDGLDLGGEELQRENAVVRVPGTAMRHLLDLVERVLAARDDHGAVALADAAAAGHQRVVLLQVRIGVEEMAVTS
jgi:hypothetical protein